MQHIKNLAILVEPANYTLDLVEKIYRPRGVDYVFIKSESLAGMELCSKSLDKKSVMELAVWAFKALKTYNVFNVNGYTGRICITLILMNILLFRKPFSIDSDTELRIPSNKIKRFVKWLWLHFLFTRKYCYGFAGGNYGHKDLFRHYGMTEERIFLMPMMVDNAKYSRNDVSRPHEPFRFGYLGRLVSIKQVDKVIEALPKECELHIVGDGEDRVALENMASGKKVTFHGRTFGEEKIRLLHSLDCLVLYSNSEPWGLVVNEALASGIPVVVSDRVGARKDLVDGGNPTGLVAKWNDVVDLTDKMRLIANDSKLYDTLSSNARKRMEYWSYDLYGKNFDAWLEKISHEKAV